MESGRLHGVARDQGPDRRAPGNHRRRAGGSAARAGTRVPANPVRNLDGRRRLELELAALDRQRLDRSVPAARFVCRGARGLAPGRIPRRVELLGWSRGRAGRRGRPRATAPCRAAAVVAATSGRCPPPRNTGKLRSGDRVGPARFLTVALALLAPTSLPAQASPAAPVAPSGFAADRLRRIDRFLQQYVDSGQIGGSVALVLRGGRVVSRHAVGWLDRESGRRMTPSALFRIASQTKALTSVVILSLVEEGKLSVDDPVSRYIPTFSHTTIA